MMQVKETVMVKMMGSAAERVMSEEVALVLTDSVKFNYNLTPL